MSTAAVERAGGGCGGSAAAVEPGRVRWVVGGDGEGGGCGGGSAARGIWRGGIAIEMEEDRDRVSS